MTEPDPLAGLRDQIRGATDAAERLLRERRSGAAPPRATGTTPPAGWQAKAAGVATAGGLEGDVAALLRLFERLRDVLPAELEQQLVDLVRQVLVLLRALLDWAVTRLEPDGRGQEIEVEDIPIG